MTRALTISIAVFALVADAGLVLSGHETISEFLYETAKVYPIIPAALGILMGHLFWPVGGSK